MVWVGGGGGAGKLVWSGQCSVSRLRMRPASDWSMESTQRALIAVQSARYWQTKFRRWEASWRDRRSISPRWMRR